MARFSRLDVYRRLLDEALVPIFHHADPEVSCRVVAADPPRRTSLLRTCFP